MGEWYFEFSIDHKMNLFSVELQGNFLFAVLKSQIEEQQEILNKWVKCSRSWSLEARPRGKDNPSINNY